MCSVSCRSIDKYFTYDVSSTTKDEPANAEILFETNLVDNFKTDDWQSFQLNEFTEEPLKPTVDTTSKEKIRCIGPATLMAMCF